MPTLDKLTRHRSDAPPPAAASTSPHSGRPKLRPALDVLNRMRWDESFQGEDLMIGYEDRFAGVMELPLSSWRQDQTDEEFIPQHRIVYFRRVADDVKIWDRKERVDLVFGSGIVKGEEDDMKDQEGDVPEQDDAVREGDEEDAVRKGDERDAVRKGDEEEKAEEDKGEGKAQAGKDEGGVGGRGEEERREGATKARPPNEHANT